MLKCTQAGGHASKLLATTKTINHTNVHDSTYSSPPHEWRTHLKTGKFPVSHTSMRVLQRGEAREELQPAPKALRLD